MAAIIAQLTRAKRERAQKVTYNTNKCLYQLPPFDAHFDPLIHNRYLARWRKIIVKNILESFPFYIVEGKKLDRSSRDSNFYVNTRRNFVRELENISTQQTCLVEVRTVVSGVWRCVLWVGLMHYCLCCIDSICVQ